MGEHAQPPSPRRQRGGLFGWLRALKGGVAFATTTPIMPPEDVAATVLAHLAARGGERTYELYTLFNEANDLHLKGQAGEDTPGYVPLKLLYDVLKALEADGRVYRQVERAKDRDWMVWCLNPWGGSRQKAGREGDATAPSGAVPGLARETLH